MRMFKIYTKLGLFNKIDLIPLQSDSVNKINMMFLVEERFYILPVPQEDSETEIYQIYGRIKSDMEEFQRKNETVGLSFLASAMNHLLI